MELAVPYVRVSGRSQVDGDGPARQIDAVRRFCAERGFRLHKTCEDLGISGTIDSFDRPGLAEAFHLADEMGTCIVVERADRIARDLIVSEVFFRECRRRNIKVFAADTGQELVFTDEDPSRKLIRQILGALAEWEKSVIVKKLRAARDRVRQETGRCEGRKEYAGPGLPFIRQWIAAGKTFREIARDLNERSIPAPAGCLWHGKTVFRIATRAGIRSKNEPVCQRKS